MKGGEGKRKRNSQKKRKKEEGRGGVAEGRKRGSEEREGEGDETALYAGKVAICFKFSSEFRSLPKHKAYEAETEGRRGSSASRRPR